MSKYKFNQEDDQMVVIKLFQDLRSLKDNKTKNIDIPKRRLLSPKPKLAYIWINNSFFHKRRAKSPKIRELNLHLERNKHLRINDIEDNKVRFWANFNSL